MNFNKTTIVGVKGHKQSGKSTVASMINYIMRVGVTAADYYKWEKCKDNIDSSIVCFADKVKKDLSDIFNIPYQCFFDIKYKEKYLYLIDEERFVDPDRLPHDYHVFTCRESLTLSDFCELYKVALTLRTLMQYYGTNIIRNNLIKDAWVRVTINEAIKTRNLTGYCIIGDVRFKNESDAIYKCNGKIISIITPHDKDTIHEHASEIIIKDVNDYVIENNGTLLQLFYKVLEFVKLYMI